MNSELQTFTTDCSPGEQGFEQTASDATTHIAELLSSESEYWGPRMHAIVRTGVRATLRTDGAVTAENIERVVENDELEESFGPDNRAEVLERFDNALRGSDDAEE
jgi:hypothetical protein